MGISNMFEILLNFCPLSLLSFFWKPMVNIRRRREKSRKRKEAKKPQQAAAHLLSPHSVFLKKIAASI
jgi:hypothetical protein